jgi:hypothetical protein
MFENKVWDLKKIFGPMRDEVSEQFRVIHSGKLS